MSEWVADHRAVWFGSRDLQIAAVVATLDACLRLPSELRRLAALRNPPTQIMPSRAIQVIPQALEVAEQQLLAQGDESELADDAFLDFKHVRAFLKSPAACAAFCFVDLHRHLSKMRLKKFELIWPAVDEEEVGLRRCHFSGGQNEEVRQTGRPVRCVSVPVAWRRMRPQSGPQGDPIFGHYGLAEDEAVVTIQSAEFDGNGRRIKKLVTESGDSDETEVRLWDSWNPCGIRDGLGGSLHLQSLFRS